MGSPTSMPVFCCPCLLIGHPALIRNLTHYFVLYEPCWWTILLSSVSPCIDPVGLHPVGDGMACTGFTLILWSSPIPVSPSLRVYSLNLQINFSVLTSPLPLSEHALYIKPLTKLNFSIVIHWFCCHIVCIWAHMPLRIVFFFKKAILIPLI